MIQNKFKIYFLLIINKIYIFEKIIKNIFINIFIINKKIKNYSF
jgi:hypothetical protein